MTKEELSKIFSRYITLNGHLRRYFVEDNDYCSKEQYEAYFNEKEDLIENLLKKINGEENV